MLWLLGGCTLERLPALDADAGPLRDARATDSGSLDATALDARVVDARVVVDAALDGSLPDATSDAGKPAATSDAGRLDAALDAGDPVGCPAPDGDTLALYTFDDMVAGGFEDGAGSNDGAAFGGVEVVRGRCRGALRIRDQAGLGPGYGLIASSPLWDEVGSIDLWLRASQLEQDVGVVSRDANGSSRPGHLTLFLTGRGQLVVRLQTSDGEGAVCSDGPIDLNRWTHVVVNFGAPGLELQVDGSPQNGAGVLILNIGGTPFGVACQNIVQGRLEGNDNPWVVGASAAMTGEGNAEPLSGHFVGGAIDHLRFSRARR